MIIILRNKFILRNENKELVDALKKASYITSYNVDKENNQIRCTIKSKVLV